MTENEALRRLRKVRRDIERLEEDEIGVEQKVYKMLRKAVWAVTDEVSDDEFEVLFPEDEPLFADDEEASPPDDDIIDILDD